MIRYIWQNHWVGAREPKIITQKDQNKIKLTK